MLVYMCNYELQQWKGLFLPDYVSTLDNPDSKKRYQEKLATIGGLDRYETIRSDWEDDVAEYNLYAHRHGYSKSI